MDLRTNHSGNHLNFFARSQQDVKNVKNSLKRRGKLLKTIKESRKRGGKKTCVHARRASSTNVEGEPWWLAGKHTRCLLFTRWRTRLRCRDVIGIWESLFTQLYLEFREMLCARLGQLSSSVSSIVLSRLRKDNARQESIFVTVNLRKNI